MTLCLEPCSLGRKLLDSRAPVFLREKGFLGESDWISYKRGRSEGRDPAFTHRKMPRPDKKRQTKLLNQETGRGKWGKRQTQLLYHRNCSSESLFSRKDRAAGRAELQTLIPKTPGDPEPSNLKPYSRILDFNWVWTFNIIQYLPKEVTGS
jgi:hypothetical protein